MEKGGRTLLKEGVGKEARFKNSPPGKKNHGKKEKKPKNDDKADEQAGHATKISSNNHQADSGQHKHHGNEAEAEAADDFFSPSVAEELGGALHGGDGREVLEGQDGNHKVTSQRPDYSDDAHDQTAEQAHALFERAQYDADRGGDERPLQNSAFARPSELEAVAEGPCAAHQAAVGDADEIDVEEHDHKIVHNVQSEHAEHKHRRLVRMEVLAGSQSRGPGRHHQERAARGDNGRDDKAGNGREHRKQHQLFVGTKNGKALLNELPTTRELTHRTLPRK